MKSPVGECSASKSPPAPKDASIGSQISLRNNGWLFSSHFEFCGELNFGLWFCDYLQRPKSCETLICGENYSPNLELFTLHLELEFVLLVQQK